MSIITISREFGSGGRELGKRLADELGFAYYDREIVTAIAERNEVNEAYVEETLDKGFLQSVPIQFGRSFSYSSAFVTGTTNLFVEQHKVLKELAAKGNCVIVGRAADTVLEEYNPFNLFVYADMPAKIDRCRERETDGEKYSDREYARKIKRIDANRAKYHDMFCGISWGDKAAYHLCVNTTDVEIKKLVPSIAEYIKVWFENNK